MGRRRDDLRQSEECAWGVFLDTLILRLRDVGEDESLALVAPPGDLGLSRQLVIRYLDDPGWTWVTRGVAGSTGAEVMVGRCVEDDYVPLAEAIVRVVRDDFRLPHPQLLTARADGAGAAHLAECLGLEDAGVVREPEPRGDGQSVGDELIAGDRDALRPMVARKIHEVFGEPADVDADGDLHFDLDGTHTVVILGEGGMAVEAVARVVQGVYSRRNTAVEVDLLNRRRMWSTWYMLDRDVFQRLLIPALPLAEENVAIMLRAFAVDLRRNRDELAYRVGGRVA